MAINVRVWGRKLHRWFAILSAAPLLLVVGTGILLQLKKDVAWVQPPTQKGRGREPALALEAILSAAKSVPEAEVQSWKDIDRIDIRPKDGIAKVQCKNRTEVQVDLETGEVLQSAERRSDFIESIHDGSWFHDRAKLWIFLPTAAVVLGLWFTGIYLFFLPLSVKWRRRWAERRNAG